MIDLFYIQNTSMKVKFQYKYDQLESLCFLCYNINNNYIHQSNIYILINVLKLMYIRLNKKIISENSKTHSN